MDELLNVTIKYLIITHLMVGRAEQIYCDTKKLPTSQYLLITSYDSIMKYSVS